MSELGRISEAIESFADLQKAVHEEFNRTLGEPLVFFADPDDCRFGHGWWRTEAGFVSYTRYANGFRQASAVFLTDDLIRQLAKHLPPT